MTRVKLEAYVDAVQGGRNYMEDVVNMRLWNASGRDVDSVGGYAFFGIFDGHGGSEAARFADEHLRREIERQETFWSDEDGCVVEAIKGGFLSTHKLMMTAVDSWPQTATGLPSTAGTTASVVIIRHNKMYIGHVGDSAVVIGKLSQGLFCDRLAAKCVTVDHKPDNVSEKERIERCGGEVVMKAGVSRVVWKRPREPLASRRRSIFRTESIPFLAIARSLGDLWSYNSDCDSYVVSPEPDVSVHEIVCGVHRCVIVASDGVWNVVSPSDAISFVERWLHQRSRLISLGKDCSCLKQPAAGLVKLALDRWQIRGMRADNISAIVVFFEPDDDVSQPAVPTAAKCPPEMCRPKRDVLRRVRLGRQRRGLRLRTVLGKICRLRAQRTVFSGTCTVRSPLGSCNRLSALQRRDGTMPPLSRGEVLVRPPRRRRCYEEACNDDGSPDKVITDPVHLKVVLHRLSVDASDSCLDNNSNTADAVSCGPSGSPGDGSSDDDNDEYDGRAVTVSGKECETDEDERCDPGQFLLTVGKCLSESDGWELSQWSSTANLCPPEAVTHSLPADIVCMSS